MTIFQRVALPAALGLALLASAPEVRAQQPPPAFSHQIVTRDAERLDLAIKAIRDSEAGRRAGAGSAGAQRDAGLKLLADGSDPRAAVRALSLAVAGAPKDTASWLGLARAFLAVAPDPSRSSERYDLPSSGAGAAWRAYETAATGREKAAALAVLAEALKRRSMWRPAIEALKASVGLDANEEVKEALEMLRAEHGFRVVDYKVDSDAAAPRLCVNLSERLAVMPPADLGKFAVIDGKEPESLTGEGNQLCFDGLKHGARYAVQVRAGLAAENGETLSKSSEIAIYVRDRKPSVRLAGRAYVLPSRGQQGIPVTTVNTKSLAVELYRIADRGLGLAAGSESFLKSIESWDLEQVREKSGRRVWKGSLEVADRLNEDVTTAIPVTEALRTLEPGVYIVATSVEARSGDSQQTTAFQWFIVSDVGLTAMSGDDGLHAFARSLATAAPSTGLQLRLVARNNEVLGTATTDANGYARFDPGLLKGEGGASPRLLVAEGKGDYALLDLATAAFDLADRGVKGRTAPGPLDAYLFAERGVYRPGETVHLTGLVRTARGEASSIPATLIVSRPDGVEHRRIPLGDQGLGGRTLALALGSGSMTGTWRAKLHADPRSSPIAETAFLVEDFVPERLALTLTPGAASIRVDEPARIAIASRYLYGPPAAGLGLEGEVLVRAAKGDVAGFPGYRFGIDSEKFLAVRESLEAPGVTAADGSAAIAVALPRFKRTARPLEADVIVRLREAGGRAIERRTTLAVDPGEARIGVKPLFAADQVGEGDEAAFDVIGLGADGRELAAGSLKWEIVRLDRRWQWYSHEGEWRYEPITTTRRMTTGTVDLADGKPIRIAYKPEWGRYRLDVTMTGGARTSVLFNAGWQPSESAESPEVLEVALDKGAYRAGETARLKITSKEAGRALVTVLAGGLLATRQVEVPKGGTEVTLTVDESWLPGVYVTATLYRSLDEGARRMPARAVGVAWLGLDTRSRTLEVKLDTPETALPGRPLAVPVRIEGLTPGEDARVTVAAVDVGILNLTRYEAPAPQKWLHAQRRLGVEMRDLYGRLIDGMRAERGRLRAGGDGNGGMSAEGSPPVEAPLSLFSGIVRVGPDGTARIDFPMPDFNGQVRVMAVAWSAAKVGSAARDVIVRDKIALTVAAPRFLTLGDSARLEVDVHNIEGADGAYRIDIDREANGSRQSQPPHEVSLKATERRRETVPLKPEALGLSTYDIRVTGPGGIDVRRRIALDVKPPATGIRRTTVSTLGPGARMSLSKDLMHDLIPSSARLSLTVGPTAAFDVAGLLGQLDRYPYGCAEQTTSRALPLLYVNDMARRLGLAEEAQIKARIAQAIDRVLEMQDGSGAFGSWGPSDGDLWLTAYVTDFLTRAKEAGYAVRPEPFGQALDRLANHLAYAQDFETGGEDRAYALYVLARNGRAPVGDLRYYADARLDRFATPLAKAQLGAALTMIGDEARAGRAFAAALAGLEGDPAKKLDGARSDYGSLVRDGAAVLTLAVETGTIRSRQPGLAQVLSAAFRGRQHTSTQEQAWMLLAARALAEEAKSTRLAVGGQDHSGELTRGFRLRDLDTPVDIVNNGKAATDAVISVEGASLTPEPATSRGFTIERSYFTLDGQKVDLASATGGTSSIGQNSRLVAVLTVTSPDAGGRVLVVDRLPAGLEVENPRLVDGGDVKTLPWLKRSREPQHTDFRDDRVVAAFSFFGEGNGRNGNGGVAQPVAATIAYIVRAVTPGSYVHPAATVEDMYRPERFARTGGGRLDVTSSR
ncbi:MAG: alpha-2-macroglobulin [Hyphomicrobiaceae bacterium]|nr:alpha-2-macroglobulin [Hyphomicrobiaceae bacterium]